MDMNGIYIAARVGIVCLVFAYFVFVPLESRFRYGSVCTALWACGLIFVSVTTTIVFLTPGQLLSEYSMLGIIMWVTAALLVFRVVVKGNLLELFFIVLVVLNLYVNIMAIVKEIVYVYFGDKPQVMTQTVVSFDVILVYMPLLWVLLLKYFKRVVELDFPLSFWRVIWIIPALTYMVFYVKIADYWRVPGTIERDDVLFSVLWSFVTYAFILVVFVMLLKAYEGIVAREEARFVTSQLQMQEEQYNSLIENIENTARVRHDMRHHLLIINGFTEDGNIEGLREYLKQLAPICMDESETVFCENHIADVILRHYCAICREENIFINVRADIQNKIGIREPDLGIIFGNLTENAVQACRMQTRGDRIIDIKAGMKGNQLVVTIKNTYNNEIVERDGVHLSTKHDGEGRGILSVKRVVEKYRGVMNIQHDDEFFEISLLLQQMNESENTAL